jgi:hypothetical protein
MQKTGHILAPIVLFVYNRPKHLETTVRCLQNNVLAQESELFIFSDAAKTAKDKDGVGKVRYIIHSINGFKKITIIERATNMGLAASVIDGVTRIVNEYGKIIVMEDDLESSPYMLQYFNAALNRYENEEKVMHIGAYMFPVDVAGLPETFFYRVATSWGWATWQRAWKHFEPDMEKSVARFDDEKVAAFSIDRCENFWKQVQEYRAGKINSWAIRWYASMFLQGGLALHPAVSMVNNTGQDASGIHSEASDMYRVKIATQEVGTFPAAVEENAMAYERIKHFCRTRKGSLWQRGIKFVRTRYKRLFR